MVLHGYFRSTASWRVRIALALKGIEVEHVSHHLRKGEQRDPDYLRLNPQGFVPALVTDGGDVLTQSLAIIEHLEEVHPEPALLPHDPLLRAKVRAFALTIACDIHPLQNLWVLQKISAIAGKEASQDWAKSVVENGLRACSSLIDGGPARFCFGDTPDLADICLVPQLGNARRFGVDLNAFPRLLEIEAACAQLPAFIAATPERQPDAE